MAKCMFPYMVQRKIFVNQADRLVPVPCGKCPQCLKRRTASWSFRIEMESLRWEKQYFITLTYNTDHVPISKHKFLTLEPDHLTKYFKRLRKRGGKLKYYAVGEYGTKNKRPHYHLILFTSSAILESDVIACWTDPKTKQSYGDVFFGKVESGSIRYCVQYYDKGDWNPAHSRDDRVPEFSRMSDGIGSNFLTDAQVKAFLANPAKGYIYDREGKKIAIPRYYKNRLYDYVGSDLTVANHPSILLHRDEMLEAKTIHHKEMEKLISQIEVPEQTKELRIDQYWQIQNYRASKRKTRK